MRQLAFLFTVLIFAFSTACSSQSGGDTAPSADKEKITTAKPEIKRVNSAEFKKAMDSLQDEIVLDVRTPDEVDQGVIPEAKVIDFWQDGFAEKASKLDKSKPVMVYCKVGGRSAEAAEVLQGLGFTEIYDLAGGMDDWKTVYPESVVKYKE